MIHREYLWEGWIALGKCRVPDLSNHFRIVSKMKLSQVVSTAALFGAALAHPTARNAKRQADIDITILQFALTVSSVPTPSLVVLIFYGSLSILRMSSTKGYS